MTELELPHYHGDQTDAGSLLEEVRKTQNFQKIADVFRQLGDPTRVRIYWLLCHREECVANIAAIMQMTSPAVSHHLRCLKDAGLVETRREGKEVHYHACNTEEGRMLHEMIEDVMQVACPK